MPLHTNKNQTVSASSSSPINWSAIISAAAVAAIPVIKAAVAAGASYLANKISTCSCSTCKTISTPGQTNDNTAADQTEYATFPGGFTDAALVATGTVNVKPNSVPLKSHVVSQTPQHAARVRLAKEQANLNLVGGYVTAKDTQQQQQEPWTHGYKHEDGTVRMQAEAAIETAEAVAARAAKRDSRRQSFFKMNALISTSRKSSHRKTLATMPQPFAHKATVFADMQELASTVPGVAHGETPDSQAASSNNLSPSRTSGAADISPSPRPAPPQMSADNVTAIAGKPSAEINQAGDSRPSSCNDDNISAGGQDIHDDADKSAELALADVSEIIDTFLATIDGHPHTKAIEVHDVAAEIAGVRPRSASKDNHKEHLPPTASADPTDADNREPATTGHASPPPPQPSAGSFTNMTQDENRNSAAAHPLLNFKPSEAPLKHETIAGRSVIVPFHDAQDIIVNEPPL